MSARKFLFQWLNSLFIQTISSSVWRSAVEGKSLSMNLAGLFWWLKRVTFLLWWKSKASLRVRYFTGINCSENDLYTLFIQHFGTIPHFFLQFWWKHWYLGHQYYAECEYWPLSGVSVELCYQMRCLQFGKHLTLVPGWKEQHMISALAKPKSDPLSDTSRLYQPNHPSCGLTSHQSTPALPDGAFYTCPHRAFGSLHGSHVVPVQPGIGDLVLRLWVGSRPFCRTRHHHGQWAAMLLKLDNMELLLVGQSLVGFLQSGRKRDRC